MNKYLLIIIALIFINIEGYAQDKLLWMDVPKTIENPTNVYDKKAKIKNNKIVIPKYNLKICRKSKTQKFYYKGEIFFDSFKFFNNDEGFFSELYGEKYFIALLKPTMDTTFHNPISVKREKMLIIDFINSPNEVFEVNLNGYLLLPSEKTLNEMIAYNKENNTTNNSKIGIIEKIDLDNESLVITNYKNESIKFKLEKHQNKL